VLDCPDQKNIRGEDATAFLACLILRTGGAFFWLCKPAEATDAQITSCKR